MLKEHFTRFFGANPGFLHVAAHSHHPWPDVTEAAHRAYWEVSATQADRKWQATMEGVEAKARRHVARLVGAPDSAQIVFAPNLHEFCARLYSCLPLDRPARVLSSAHEFHSFTRQTRRLVEAGRVAWETVPADPWDSFPARFATRLASDNWDLVWLSHVFFDSGYRVPDLEGLTRIGVDDGLFVIDGYHAFCALPVDIGPFAHRAFYAAGGYKYAMAGEGACFLCVPPGCELRPVNTGWWGDFESLARPQEGPVGYSPGAERFRGSTADLSGLMRFNAVWDLMEQLGVTPAAIQAHVASLQARFLDGLDAMRLARLGSADLVPPRDVPRGNFLAFERVDAADIEARLIAANVYIDRRGTRLRFGFGVYHDASFVDALLAAVRSALK
jgi:selenocysteine lyase/cysteine desulfurase